MLKLVMNPTIEAKPSVEFPKPGATENLNGVSTMIDGALVFIALMANRGDLAVLALFGLVIGSITCFRLVDGRRGQTRKSQNETSGNDFWEAPDPEGV